MQLQAFIHPGLRHSSATLQEMKTRVRANQEPWKSAYTTMIAWRGFRDAHSDTLGRPIPSSLSFVAAPVAEINVGYYEKPRTGQDLAFVDATAAYVHAIKWYVYGDPLEAQKTIEICNEWGNTLKKITGDNRKLAAAWICSLFLEGAEIVRSTYTGTQNWTAFDNMLRTVFYPQLNDFVPTYNGNWDAFIIQAKMSMGVFLNEQSYYDSAKNYLLNGCGNGTIPNYIRLDGTTQESDRDQYHEQMGVLALTSSCEIGWTQGEDFYSTLNNRLLLGLEGTANRCLSQPKLPIYDGWDIAYNHYNKRRKLATPVMDRLRSSGRWSGVNWTYTTISFWPKMFFYNTTVTTIPVTGVSLSSVTLSLNKGAQYQLVPNVIPFNATDNSVRYSSNNTNVATVNSSGLISAVAPGSATITVTTNNGTKTANCTVTVSANATLYSVADTYVSVLYPDSNYVDSYILAVNGNVNNADNRKSYLKFDLSELGYSGIGTATLRLYANTVPATTKIKALQTTDNWTEATVTYSNCPTTGLLLKTVSVLAEGYYDWDITSYVQSQLAANDQVISLEINVLGTNSPTINFNSRELNYKPELIITGGVTGIDTKKMDDKPKIWISPNPFRDETIIQSNFQLENAEVAVYNTLGQSVKTIKNIAGNNIILQRNNLPSGMYFYRLTEGSKVLSTWNVIAK